MGNVVAQTSCTKPGSVSAAERAPPPKVSLASTTSTAQPARARYTAAASPLGPLPTTTASQFAKIVSLDGRDVLAHQRAVPLRAGPAPLLGSREPVQKEARPEEARRLVRERILTEQR